MVRAVLAECRPTEELTELIVPLLFLSRWVFRRVGEPLIEPNLLEFLRRR